MKHQNRLFSFKHNKKSEKELDKHYENINLEKGDLAAMLIAALLTFGPLIIVISLIYVGIALLFGLRI